MDPQEPKQEPEPHPEVVRWIEYEAWTRSVPFPLTPLEA